MYKVFIHDYLVPAAPQDLYGCPDLPCAASCPKVRSHPRLQWWETSVCSSVRWRMLGGKAPSHHRAPASTTAAECHMSGKTPCCAVPASRCGYPAWRLPSRHSWYHHPQSRVTNFHLSLAAWGQCPALGSAVGVMIAMCAGPQVTNCCLQLFLLSMEMCLQVS